MHALKPYTNMHALKLPTVFLQAPLPQLGLPTTPCYPVWFVALAMAQMQWARCSLDSEQDSHGREEGEGRVGVQRGWGGGVGDEGTVPI